MGKIKPIKETESVRKGLLKPRPILKDKSLKKKTSVISSGVKKHKTRPRLSKKMKKTLIKPKGKKGVVYLSHIPHGFYEDQIESYFKQFGVVTAVSVPRSKTGKARGYAFIEFQHPEVAQIAADTMNNYLMFNRVIKAKYIPPEEQKPRYFLSAQVAQLTHSTLPEQSALNVKHQRMLKNRRLKISKEVKVLSKIMKRCQGLDKLTEQFSSTFQVDSSSVELLAERFQGTKQTANLITKLRARKLKEDCKEKPIPEADDQPVKKVKKITKSTNTDTKSKGIVKKTAHNFTHEKCDTNSSVNGNSSEQKHKIKDTPSEIFTQKQNNRQSKRSINKNSTNQNTNEQIMKSSMVDQSGLTVSADSVSKKRKSGKAVKIPQTTHIHKDDNIVLEVDEDEEEIDFKTPPNVSKVFKKAVKESAKTRSRRKIK